MTIHDMVQLTTSVVHPNLYGIFYSLWRVFLFHRIFDPLKLKALQLYASGLEMPCVRREIGSEFSRRNAG